jgi:hypothetical protein
MYCCLYLRRLAGNMIGYGGAGRLAEALGKLTALQELDLSGMVGGLFSGIDCVDGWDWATACVCVCI